MSEGECLVYGYYYNGFGFSVYFRRLEYVISHYYLYGITVLLGDNILRYWKDGE